MKYLLHVLMALFMTSVLTACGGESNTNTTADNADVDSAELIINNGRGTVNGRDTEMPRRK